MQYPEVTLKFIDHIWIAGHFKRAFIELDRFIQNLEKSSFPQGASFAYYDPTSTLVQMSQEFDLNSVTSNDYISQTNLQITNRQTPAVINKLLSRAYLKMAECQEFLVGFSEQSIPTILDYYQKATDKDKHWYKAWHSWAFMNFRALKYCKEKQPKLAKNLELPLPRQDNNLKLQLNPKLFCIQSVQGFFRSVTLSHESSLQDTLRILALCFEDGYHDQVRAPLEEGIKNVSIETWLQVGC